MKMKSGENKDSCTKPVISFFSSLFKHLWFQHGVPLSKLNVSIQLILQESYQRWPVAVETMVRSHAQHSDFLVTLGELDLVEKSNSVV